MADGNDSLAQLLSGLGILAASIAAWISGQRYGRRASRRDDLPAIDQTQIFFDGPLAQALGLFRSCESTLKRIEEGIARQQHTQNNMIDDQGRTLNDLGRAIEDQVKILKSIAEMLEKMPSVNQFRRRR